ncbi:MAG: pyrroline-5-carboxylate reductase [Clostridia bacterium]|nr:pyrroline-5-carboxylate reductase [Clostridia bacterium]MBR7100438.1 pyrroline-5-carboxylate reductase [Clostridia bacterium]
MKKQFKLGVIGAGFMAYAIVKGAIESDFLRSNKIFVSDCNKEQLEKFKDYGCFTTTDNRRVASNCDYLLIAVKPQQFLSVSEQIKDCEFSNVISIMAGIDKNKIRTALPQAKKICRVMPNLPCSIGSGMVAADVSDFKTQDDLQFFAGLFDSLGSYIFTEESKMHAVTGISGSGPAYVFLFIKSLIEAGKKQGLTEEEACVLAAQTVAGGVDMYIHEKDETDIDTLIQRVCSKGGTTEQAMLSFEKDGFCEVVDRAVSACVARSEELAK